MPFITGDSYQHRAVIYVLVVVVTGLLWHLLRYTRDITVFVPSVCCCCLLPSIVPHLLTAYCGFCVHLLSKLMVLLWLLFTCTPFLHHAFVPRVILVRYDMVFLFAIGWIHGRVHSLRLSAVLLLFTCPFPGLHSLPIFFVVILGSFGFWLLVLFANCSPTHTRAGLHPAGAHPLPAEDCGDVRLLPWHSYPGAFVYLLSCSGCWWAFLFTIPATFIVIVHCYSVPLLCTLLWLLLLCRTICYPHTTFHPIVAGCTYLPLLSSWLFLVFRTFCHCSLRVQPHRCVTHIPPPPHPHHTCLPIPCNIIPIVVCVVLLLRSLVDPGLLTAWKDVGMPSY